MNGTRQLPQVVAVFLDLAGRVEANAKGDGPRDLVAAYEGLLWLMGEISRSHDEGTVNENELDLSIGRFIEVRFVLEALHHKREARAAKARHMFGMLPI